MGFSYRKGLRIGPVRLNLSGSGIGASVGVRGLRVGTSAGGRSYLRAGRGGLVYQASLGSVCSQAPVSQLSQLDSSPSRPRSGGSGCLVSLLVLICLGFGLVVLLPVLQTTAAPEAKIVSGIGLAVVVSLIILIVGAQRGVNRRSRAVAHYLEAARALATSPQLTSADAGEVLALRAAIRTTSLPTSTEAGFEAAYRTAVAEVVADQQVTMEERRRLEIIGRGLSLSAEVLERANLNGFMQGYAALVADGRLAEEEEGKLEELRKAFRVPKAAVSPQMTKADELRRARLVGETALAPVSTGIKLKKGEECYHETAVTRRAG